MRRHGVVAALSTACIVAMVGILALLGSAGSAGAARHPKPTRTTATVSPSPTATATVTPTPTPTATATVPTGAFPDASNTGVPVGTVLTAYTGPSNITTANTVIDGKTIGCIQVSAPGVIIRNSRIICSSFYAVYVDDRTSTATLLTVEDSEISCGNSNGTAVGEADVTVRRTEITGCENGFDVNQNVTVEDSFIHDLFNGNAAHADGLQMAGGHWDGSSYPCCALNVTVRHNTILSADASGALGTSAIISNSGGDTDILIDNNLMAGGAFTLYCEQGATGVNYRVTNNHFSTQYRSTVGAYGPSTECADETQSGNVYHETGAPLFLN